MKWPSEDDCKFISDVWQRAYGSGVSPGESDNARAKLRRLQREHGLTETELAYVAEHTQKQPTKSKISPQQVERPLNLLELILFLLGQKHFHLSLEQEVVVALWILHTYVYDQFLHTPRLGLRSSEVGAGKSTLFSFINLLAHNSFYAVNTTPAVVYRELLEHPRTTFLLDEIENSQLWADDRLLLNILDVGFYFDGFIPRIVDGKVFRFPVFAPVALAMVSGKRLPPQLWSRSIFIDMKKRPGGQDEFRPHDERFATIRALIFAWAGSFRRPQVIELPRSLTNRDADLWRALVAIGDDLGYGATARAAALALHHRRDDQVANMFISIFQIFEQTKDDRIWTNEELLPALWALEDADWDEYRGLDETGKPHKITRGEVYDLLKVKGLKSQSIQRRQPDGSRVSKKGFYCQQFEPVWAELLGGTPAHSSKIIRLPWHKDGTGLAQASED